nr:MAG: hypothetical protein DIU68_10655 [Chloroflexota bacterium]
MNVAASLFTAAQVNTVWKDEQVPRARKGFSNASRQRGWRASLRTRFLRDNRHENLNALHFLVEHTGDIISCLDSDGIIRYITPSIQAMLGYPPTRFEGASIDLWLEFAHPDDAETVLAAHRRLRQTDACDERYEFRCRHADGHYVWFEASYRAPANAADPPLAALHVLRDISHRKPVELALREAETRYRSVISVLAEAILIVDKDGTIQSCNASAEHILQQPASTLIGLRPEQYIDWLIGPDGAPIALEDFALVKTLQTGEPQTNVVVGVRRSEGETLWLSLNTHCIDPSSGGTGGLVASFFDISDYRRALRAESEQRALAEALRDTASALSSTLDPNEVLDRILENVSRLFDHDTAEIMLIEGERARVARILDRTDDGSGTRFHSLNLPSDAFATFRHMIQTGLPIAVSHSDADPSWVPIPESRWVRSYLGAPIRLDGKVIGFLNLNSAVPGLFSDADLGKIAAFADQAAIALRNARLFAELEARVDERTAELRLERQLLQAILDGNGEGIIYTEGARIRYANKAITQLTGYTSEELLGQPTSLLHDQVVQADSIFNSPPETLVPGQVWRDEIRMRHKDGRQWIAGLTLSCLGKTSDAGLRCVILVRDISQEKALQEQKARFVAHASHELRTPLTNFITRLYLLRRMPERLPEHLEVLDDVSNRMRRLVEDLLDLSRFERGAIKLHREKITLQSLVDHVVRLQEEEARFKEITIQTVLPEAPFYVHADRERMHQVLTNLVTNAINYTPYGGEIVIHVSAERDADGYRARVAVEDNGPGIDPTHIDYIFQPFYRVMGDQNGAGLGLSIARELVELHGGSIQVESLPGHGSRFSICLDLAEPFPPAEHE